jgi:hypothetical protein
MHAYAQINALLLLYLFRIEFYIKLPGATHSDDEGATHSDDELAPYPDSA